MADFVFPGPKPCLRNPDQGLLQEAQRHFQASNTLTREESREFLDWLIYQMLIYKDLDDLHGLCGATQCFGVYVCEDLGVEAKPFVTHSFNAYYGHAAYVVKLNVEGEEKFFLMDPTFRQFCKPESCRQWNKDPHPGYHLAQREEEIGILNTLLTQGYIELTPKIAEVYLNSFCNFLPVFQDFASAFEFLKNPPYDSMNLWFTRGAVNRMGFGIEVGPYLLPPSSLDIA